MLRGLSRTLSMALHCCPHCWQIDRQADREVPEMEEGRAPKCRQATPFASPEGLPNCFVLLIMHWAVAYQINPQLMVPASPKEYGLVALLRFLLHLQPSSASCCVLCLLLFGRISITNVVCGTRVYLLTGYLPACLPASTCASIYNYPPTYPPSLAALPSRPEHRLVIKVCRQLVVCVCVCVGRGSHLS